MTVTSTGTTGQDASTAEQAIRLVIEAYGTAMSTADVDAILDLYTPDAAVMGPDMPTTVGRRDLADLYRGALDAVAMDYEFTIDQIAVRGDTAVARTRTDGENTVRASGQHVPGRYRELFVLNRHEGSWKIAQYMFQPRPPQEA